MTFSLALFDFEQTANIDQNPEYSQGNLEGN